MRTISNILFRLVLLAPVLCCPALIAEDHGTRVTRLLWQNRDTDSLMWGEVFSGDKWVVTASAVKGFPKLDVEKQDLMQMKQAEGMLLVGVRDNDDGKHQSGWVAIDTGVRQVPHGNHSDWTYPTNPIMKASRLDANQGNPAHLYLYNGTFFMANDAKNGFTRIAPSELMTKPAAECGTFFSGGGNHITLAAIDNTICYSTWIDGGGPNQGRVDVVNLKKADADNQAYSFRLPTGVIHGTTANAGRVFFAPADGICWVDADPTFAKTAETVVVNHISLGKEEGTEKPNRTGAFINHRNWVLFTTGGPDAKSALCLLDAASAAPNVVKVPIDVAVGLSLTTPEVVLAAGGKRYAFLFQDRKEGDVQEQLTIVDLDPNGDRSFSDARIAKSIPVPASKVDGHHGHHSISFDSEGKLACFTNPGDGSIWVMTLKDLEVRAKSKVGGTPAAISAIGAAAHHH